MVARRNFLMPISNSVVDFCVELEKKGTGFAFSLKKVWEEFFPNFLKTFTKRKNVLNLFTIHEVENVFNL